MRCEHICSCPVWREAGPWFNCVFIVTNPQAEGMHSLNVACILRGGKVQFWTSVWTWTCWTEPIGSGSVWVQFSPYPIGSGSGSGTHPECRTGSELVQTLNLGSNKWREMAVYTCDISRVWQCASGSIEVLQTFMCSQPSRAKNPMNQQHTQDSEEEREQE